MSLGIPVTALAADSFGSLSYRGIGPAIGGGRSTAVVGSDDNPHVYYAGGADGGVFKSVDDGATWTPIFDKQPVAAIGAIVLDPRDPNDVWVGTGEAYPRNTMERGDGMWRSRDGGKTWTHLGLDDAGSISRITIDPRNPNHVAVAALGQLFRDNTTRGVYVTTDGGAHWKRTLYAGANIGASDLVRVPDRPNTLFAGMYYVRRTPWGMNEGGPGSGIFRSDDGGATWRMVSGHGLPAQPIGRIGLAAGTRGRVYAIVQAHGGDVWRSDNGGVTWRVMPHSQYVGARRFYFTRIYLDPANDDKLICAGLNLAMTTNGAKTWTQISKNAGWDYHFVWWSRDGLRVWASTDENVIASNDGAKTWKQHYDLPFAQPYHIGFDDAKPNYHVCVGLQDDSSWCGSSNSDSGLGVLNRDWYSFAGGDGMWALYDPKDPNFIWTTSTSSAPCQVYLYDVRTHQAYDVSPDAEMGGNVPAKALRYRFNWTAPIAFTSDGKALVGGNVVFESSDRGQHWTAVSPDLTRNDRSKQQIPGGPVDQDMSGAEAYDTLLDVAPSPIDKTVTWAGSDDGVIHVSRDGMAHWSNVTPSEMPAWARVATVEPGRFDAATAFAVADHHMNGDDRPYIFATTNYGASWTKIVNGLPSDAYVRVVRQDLRDANLLYAGTSRGVYASWDRGAHWRSLRLNMPATAIYDIQIQPRTNDLIVASHGRGVWIFDDATVLQRLTTIASSSVALLPIRNTERWYRAAPINSFTDGTLPSNIFAAPNAPFGAILTYNIPATGAKKAKPAIDVLDARGRIVRHLSGSDVPHDPGINRTAWDLQEDGPAKWMGTFKENQGPGEGAEVLPGTYTIRLRLGGTTREQTVVVEPDPRDSQTTAQMQLRYDVLSELNGELSTVDKWLNAIDKATRHPERSRGTGGTSDSRHMFAEQASGSSADDTLTFRAKLTYNPRNVEDLSGPVGLRDRLLDLIGRITSTSYQPPNQPQIDEAANLRTMFEQLSRTAREVLINN